MSVERYIDEWIGLPETPDWAQELNTIVKFWEDPCHAPWSVYVETLFPAVGGAVLALVTPDMSNIITSYLRPRSGLTRGHKRTKGRRRTPVSTLFNLEELIAERLPFYQWVAGRNVGNFTKFFWRLEGVVELIGWNFLIIGTTIDGFYWWCTLINHSDYCSLQGQAMAEAYNATIPFFAAAGQWGAVQNWQTLIQQGGCTVSTTGISVPAGRWNMIIMTGGETYFGATGDVGIRLLVAGQPVGETVQTTQIGETFQIALSVTIEGPASGILQTRARGVLVDGQEGYWYAIP
jgi:hypothetical protein